MKKRMMYRFIGILVYFSIGTFMFTDIKAQFVPVHADYADIYSFIDELANDGIIDLNSVCKPYSRNQIAQWLVEAQTKSKQLNERQKKEVGFYLKQFEIDLRTKNPSTYFGYAQHKSLMDLNEQGQGNDPRFTVYGSRLTLNPLAFSYTDSLFRMRIEPLWGIRQYLTDNDKLAHYWGGGTAFAYLGEGWSFYANVRDNHMTGASLTNESYFTQFPGGNVKTDPNFTGSDFSEMRGGINYTCKWGNIGLVKDHVQWGDHYNGALIASGRTPSFPMIKFQLTPVEWMQFNYYHGWLVSEVVDSSLLYRNISNKVYRQTFRKKFIAANMFSFRLMRAIWLSIGNSIVYSDMDAHPAYLIPFMFYKSVDHTVNWGIENQNSQMFMNISTRRIKHLHLYGSFYIDEWSFSRVNDPYRNNFTSQKIGFRLSNWLLKNISITGEYTQSSPVTYKHKVNTLTYESNGYNLGWFMRDNSQNYFASIEYKPLKSLNITMFYDHSLHGNEYAYKIGYEDSLPVRKNKSWESVQMGLKIRYQLVNNMFLTADFYSNNSKGFPTDGKTAKEYLEMFTAPILRGKNNIINVGFNIGF